MILFKKHFIPHILGQTAPLKTVTRRVGNKRWNIGAIHTLQTNYNSNSAFARAEILNVYRQNLFDMTDEDAIKEGCHNLQHFKEIWTSINGEWKNIEVWVIEFQVTEVINKNNTLPVLNLFN